MKKTIPLLILTCTLLSCQAQPQNPKHEEVINELATDLKANYVFEKEGLAMHDLLLKNLHDGKYEEIPEGQELAEALLKDVRSIADDKHLHIRYKNQKPPSKFANREIKKLPDGIGEVKILDGNVGYLEITGFNDTNDRYKTALSEKMSLLSKTDAIIFDLRNNGGGSPESVRLISSYLFPDGTAVHLNSLYFRNRNWKTDFYTFKKVDGERLDKKPVYILTSDYTFSAGEEFCYNLQNLDRATLVGETTGGGAHPVNFHQLPNDMIAIIPEGRAINPITGTNWEGVGVVPDHQVDESMALEKTLEIIKSKPNLN